MPLPMQPTRRAVVGGALLSLSAARWLNGLPSGERALVVVQLRGGNDGLNTVVPRDNDHYRRARPELALEPSALLPLNDDWGWHPALAHTARRFAAGGAAVVQGVGHPRPNLSHFRSQDIWDVGSVAEPRPTEGWMGRECDLALGEHPSPLAMLAFGRDVLPRAMGAKRALACAVPSIERYRVRTAPEGQADAAEARRRAIEALNPGAGEPSLARLADAARAARASTTELARVARNPAKAEYPPTKLGRELALAARVLAAGLPTRFIYVTQDGYDTHVAQLGIHANLLADLDAALDAFQLDLERSGIADKVLVMTISDFGRRVAQNGVERTAGTDHGAASMMLLLGAGVRAGLHGSAPDLADLDGHGNLKHRTDFRQVYATVIEDWLGGDAPAVLGGTFAKLDLIQC
jgi:uncharacterized protein (DUF1501 family)